MGRPWSKRRRSGKAAALVALTLALGANLGGYAQPPAASAATSPFTDIAGTTFETDIEWLYVEGITDGCAPTLYCPDDPVSRGQMAKFFVRMFDLPATDTDFFEDDASSAFQDEINQLAASRITVGCAVSMFCPQSNVTRAQMATFLARAIPLTVGSGNDYFRDDDGTTHEANIDRAAAGGIATGCGTWRFCPDGPLSRGHMAAFLHRVIAPVTAAAHPAPSGPQAIYISTDGNDANEPCFEATAPCRTVRFGVGSAVDGDTVHVAAGTYRERGISIRASITVEGVPSGSVIDASGSDAGRAFSVAGGRSVTLRHLRLSGGHAYQGGAIFNYGTLRVDGSRIDHNQADNSGGGIYNAMGGVLTLVDTVVADNRATYAGGGVYAGGGGYRDGAADAGVIIFDRVTIARNTAFGGGGGGVLVGDGSITDSVISDNVATMNTGGGGIAAYCSDGLEITKTTISGNSAAGGGGIGGRCPLTVASSTIAGNRADLWGGGISDGAPTVIVNTTMVDNHAGFGGGAMTHAFDQPGDDLTIVGSTVTGNSAGEHTGGIQVFKGQDFASGSWTLRNSIVAGNAAPAHPDVSGTITIQLATIVGIPTGLTLANILDPTGPADHGGPTQTIALTDSVTNPARHKGDAATCAGAQVHGLDQRGLPRTPPCDIGAYELQP